MQFDQIPKHRPGGQGSPCLWPNDDAAAKALMQSVEVKVGMRAIKLPAGQVAVFRSASKKPNTFGYDVWHGGWQASARELELIGDVELPTYQP